MNYRLPENVQAGKEQDSKELLSEKIFSSITQHRTYCGNKLINTVRSYTVEVCEVELQVDLVVEHVLA